MTDGRSCTEAHEPFRERNLTMLKYTIKRVLQLIPVLIGVVVVIFTINYVTGMDKAVINVLISTNKATAEVIAAKEHELGLDRPYLIQLLDYFWNLIAHGSMGTSYVQHREVTFLIGQRIGNTVRIGLGAALLSTIVGVPLGIVAAVKQNTVMDYISTFFATLTAALPSFWLCLIFMRFFCVKLQWLPLTGVATWKGYILPILATGLMPVAMTMRMTRSSMLEVVRQDYIRTARAKGVPEKKVVLRHILQNSMVPVVTTIGMNLGQSMTGSVIAETIFNINGLGNLMSTSIMNHDTVTVQGCVLICAFIISGMNLLTDLAYAAIDPRIRAQYSSSGKKRSRKTKKQKEVAAA